MVAAIPDLERWSPARWRGLEARQLPDYADGEALARVEAELALSEAVARISESAALREKAARVAGSEGLILQGGDCAETLGKQPGEAVTAVISLFDILAGALGEPLVRVGRIAGQFAKPRSNAIETRGRESLPAYRGDGINSSDFNVLARASDPERMLAAHRQSVATARLLQGSGIFTSHEALLLPYEQALARQGDDGRWWATSGHMLWAGERTRQVAGAHIDFLSGIENLVGVKCGPGLGPDEMLRLLDRLDPANRAGKVALIGRFGAEAIGERLPLLLRAGQREGRQILWMTDPMHGNSRIEGERKVRRFDDIMAETRAFFAICAAEKVHPGGIHLEMSAENVTECIGASGPGDAEEMAINFQSLCDPRLNAAQAEQLVRMVAELIREMA